MTVSNDSLSGLLQQEQVKTQRLLEELRTVKSSNATEIRRLKKELTTLRKVMGAFYNAYLYGFLHFPCNSGIFPMLLATLCLVLASQGVGVVMMCRRSECPVSTQAAPASRSMRQEQWRYFQGKASNVPDGADEYWYIKNGNATGATVTDDGYCYRGLSYFTRLNYNYNDKYLLMFTMFGRSLHRDNRTDQDLLNEALKIAANADVIVAALGESSEMSGESSSRSNLDLPDVQRTLLEALLKTGKPVVLTLFAGRPMTLSWEQAHDPRSLGIYIQAYTPIFWQSLLHTSISE